MKPSSCGGFKDTSDEFSLPIKTKKIKQEAMINHIHSVEVSKTKVLKQLVLLETLSTLSNSQQITFHHVSREKTQQEQLKHL